MMAPALTLVSHVLCPYVQRAAIVLAEKGAPFERRDVDLSRKPDWFMSISPLGKTPVLLVGTTPIFESAVICEYLDDTIEPRMHSGDPLQRARHRAYIELGSSLLNAIGAFYSAPDDAALEDRGRAIGRHFQQLEAALSDGPYFGGEAFSIVDATFGPVFRYFDVIDAIGRFDFFAGLPKVSAWRAQLARRHSVRGAVCDDYAQRLRAFLLARQSALSRRMTADRPLEDTAMR